MTLSQAELLRSRWWIAADAYGDKVLIYGGEKGPGSVVMGQARFIARAGSEAIARRIVGDHARLLEIDRIEHERGTTAV